MSTSNNWLADPEWLKNSRLWLVTDRAASAPRSLEDSCLLAIAGGVDAVLFRMKEETDPLKRREHAINLQEVCRDTGTPFIISHELELALALEADGLQLGVGDAPLKEVRKAWDGEGRVLGYSAHSVEEAAIAAAAGADYVFIGPVFATPSKAEMGEPLGVDTAARAARELAIPVVAIGGIDGAKLPSLVSAGIGKVAAIRALQAVRDPRSTAREMQQILEAGASLT
jgi:thiamine-phosphate pyrophosphorylase